MSLYIKRVELQNFKKFRQPFVIEGLGRGLNIIIEPNETGKSTVLEALRAAFFIRHSTKNELARGFAPHGESVAPEVEVEFETDGADWKVAKKFLKSPSIEVSGPGGRAQGDEAEDRLHQLLGSKPDKSRNWNPESYGALGLLWVAQADALEVDAPNEIVRDTVRSTLEAEVGSIVGGKAFDKVYGRIHDQYGKYWTETGQKRQPLKDAEVRLAEAEEAAASAEADLAALERTFAELEERGRQLKVLQRDLANEDDKQKRRELEANLSTARSARDTLERVQAQHEEASTKAAALRDLKDRFETAKAAIKEHEDAFAEAAKARGAAQERLHEAKTLAAKARDRLKEAREKNREAQAAVAATDEAKLVAKRASATRDAHERHEQLIKLEERQLEARKIAARAVASEDLEALEKLEHAVADARARMEAGATSLEVLREIEGAAMNGAPLKRGAFRLTSVQTISLGGADALILRPPENAESARERFESAQEALLNALKELDVANAAEARKRHDAAKEASGDLQILAARIEALTPSVEILKLPAGPEALKLFAAEHDEPEQDGEAAEDDQAAVAEAAAEAEAALREAELAAERAEEELRLVREDYEPLSTRVTTAEANLANAKTQLEAIEARPELPTLDSDLGNAAKRSASLAADLQQAEENAKAYDEQAIRRQIEMLDERARKGQQKATDLDKEIARLEATLEVEGGKGLAERAAAAQDKAAAAAASLERITEEAETVKLLRGVLDEARTETTKTFVGPVARRAKQHIERLLPGCELTFTEDLGLEAVVRAGVSEGCADLSKGTQEQLAVLTRLAFADMLLDQGTPVSLILDDPLVYSDDARLDLMTEILTEASNRMQVILLTCRDRAFRHVEGNRIELAKPA